MNAPTTATTDLQAQLAAARDVVAETERALGDAVLDGTSMTKLAATLDKAKAEEAQLVAAIEAAGRRQVERDAQTAAEERRQERAHIYASAADWLPHVDSYVRARVALDEAEETLRANAPHHVIRSLKNHSLTWADRRVGDLDKPLLSQLPNVPHKGSNAPLPDPKRFTPERISELIARAKELAKAEEAGEDIAITPDERAASQGKARERRAVRRGHR